MKQQQCGVYFERTPITEGQEVQKELEEGGHWCTPRLAPQADSSNKHLLTICVSIFLHGTTTALPNLRSQDII